MTKIDTEYKVHNEDGVGVGGQTAVRGEFPPYIKRESPEEEHWKKMNPNGWKEVRQKSMNIWITILFLSLLLFFI
jgi:hypothetical protein